MEKWGEETHDTEIGNMLKENKKNEIRRICIAGNAELNAHNFLALYRSRLGSHFCHGGRSSFFNMIDMKRRRTQKVS